ncbi:Uncharacterised protein [Klebsiella pneumoniae]|nr:Uncharacterised protein [Klebsiella pneumoniae]SSN10813.1 Uncharacterised protein [Klebsiella pneumoniae]
MSGVDGAADIAENALLLLRGRGRRRELFTEDGADKGFQFCCIH